MGTVTLLIATNNSGKLRELSAMLADLQITIVRPVDVGVDLRVDETGTTYLANARLKACAFASRTGLLSLADDTGLEVAALGGWPGTHSARVGGPNASAGVLCQLVLDRMARVPVVDRSARFVSSVVVCAPDGTVAEAAGVLEGRIATSPSGSGGFGYDPIFIPNGDDRTLADVPQDEKNLISSRARAVAGLRKFFEALSRA